jgi:hypothetical protein
VARRKRTEEGPVRRTRRWAAHAIIPGLLAIGLLAGPSAAQSATYSGQATGARVTVLGNTTVLSDTGPLPPSGGAREASLLEATVPGTLSAEALHASTVGQGNVSRAEASVANADLTVAGNHIAADFLMARAEAECTGGGPSVSGNSDIARLVINGQEAAVTGAPNQTISLPNGRVVVNEQQSSPGDITVNALHVIVDGVADVVISSAHADISCKGPDCTRAGDFVTGGGWITGTPSGSKGTFGVAGGLKNGQFWGHLTYLDRGASLKVKGTAVTAYAGDSKSTARHIEGTAEINGQPGTYQVDLSDNGEPGRSDTFNLRLSNGYRASGNLGGGNIQLHQPRPCQSV